MPLILQPTEAKRWIDKDLNEDDIKSLMKPFESSRMKAHTVQKFIPAKPGYEENKEVIAYYYYPELVDLFDNNNKQPEQ